MKLSLPPFKIDWPNHLIGFFSALFGILIAFELDNLREAHNQADLSRIAFENLKKEIQINQSLLHENTSNNLRYIHSLQGLLPQINNQLLFIGTTEEADSVNLHFGKIIFVDVGNASMQDKRKKLMPIIIGMGNINVPSMQSSAWESAKATGALNLMDYEKVLALSFIYNHSRIMNELNEVRSLWQASDNIVTKTALSNLLNEMGKSHQTLDRELLEFDQFVNILYAME